MSNILHSRHERLPTETVMDTLAYLPVVEIARAMGVSRMWRDSISHSAALWTNLDLLTAGEGAISALPTVLRRSSSMPLSLAIRLTAHVTVAETNALCELLRPDMSRMRHLKILSEYRIHAQVVLDFLCCPLPQLLILEVSTLTNSREYLLGSHLRDGLTHIPDLPLAFAAPNLRYLDCGETRLRFGSASVPSVNELSISNRHCSFEHIFTVFPYLLRLRVESGSTKSIGPDIPLGHPIRVVDFVVPDVHTNNEPIHSFWGVFKDTTGLDLLSVRGCSLDTLTGAAAEANGRW